jgi:hypothetical protein
MNRVRSGLEGHAIGSYTFGAVILIGLFGIPAAVHVLAVLAA